MTVRGRGSKPKTCSSVPGLEVCVTYGLGNLGCPRPSCVQICERSSKTLGAFRDLSGEAWPELDCLSLKTEGAGLGGEGGALLGPQLGAQK